MPDHIEHNAKASSSRAKWAFGGFTVIGALFLLAEHRAHVLPYLPWLILLACPLMHIFMHGGHGGHHGGGDRPHGGNGGSSGTTPEGSWEGNAGPKSHGHSQHGGRP